MTIEQVQARIAEITAQLDADTRECRPSIEGEDVREVPIYQTRFKVDPVSMKETPFEEVVGVRRELPGAAGIRAERAELKAERRTLRRKLASIALEAEAEAEPRPVAQVEADIARLMLEVRTVKEKMRALNRERDRALIKGRVEKMSDAEKAALRRLLAE